jgi:tetratricopeptide (TPR) repeat protein
VTITRRRNDEKWDMISILNRIGIIKWKMGKYEKSKKILRGALNRVHEIQAQSLHRIDDENEESRQFEAEILDGIGRVLVSQGRYEDVKTYYEKNLEVLTRYTSSRQQHHCCNHDEKEEVKMEQEERSSKEIIFHPAVGRAHISLGIVDGALGRHKEALHHFRRGYCIQRRILGPEHVNAAKTFNAFLGSSYDRVGKLTKSLKCFKK